MGAKDDEFLQRLLATFKIEADENLKSITTGLLELEKTTDPDTRTRLIERVFREAHSLKGAARAVNKRDVELVCQSIEGVFSGLKRHTLALSPAAFDTLHHALDTVEGLLASTGEDQPAVSEVVAQLDQLLDARPISAAPPSPPPPPAPTGALPTPPARPAEAPRSLPQRTPPPLVEESSPPEPEEKPAIPAPAAPRLPAADTIRISASRLDNLFLQAEELLSVKLTTAQHVSDLQDITVMLEMWQREWVKTSPEVHRLQRYTDQSGTLRISSGCHPSLVKMLDFIDWNRAQMEVLIDRVHTLTKTMAQEQRTVGGMIDNLLEDVKKSLMLPFSTLLDTFPKMVRDLSRAQGKEVAIVLKGGEVEIDRRILEEVKTPLIHILRNSIDHGIEKPAVREKNNKPRQGTITVSVAQPDASRVEIIVTDDGAGIDVASLKQAAVRHGYISTSEADKMNEEEALFLIYRSSVSTSAIITDISGRGLGMTIVREKVEQLGGQISASTAPYIGTSFQILLPVTVATSRGVLVQAGNGVFVIPTSGVERVLRVRKDQVKLVQNGEVIQVGQRSVPLVYLADVLELPRAQSDPNEYSGHDSPYLEIVLLGGVDQRRAFVVERVINEQEVLVKNLGKQLARVRNVSGATILGSGRVVPILHVLDLLKSAERLNSRLDQTPKPVEPGEKLQKSILIAEDSITSRMLLKNILEGAGYRVQATVDGTDALTALKTDSFDLLVSDIEMPRMNGLELTAKIRADQKLSGLPVILVTSLGSPEDREKGIDAGADAYITKSSFDQTNLLAVIKRLI